MQRDARLQGVAERCEMYRTYVQWSDLLTPEAYLRLEGGGCSRYPMLRRTNFD